MIKENIKIKSFEDKNKNQQFLNKCKLLIVICLVIIGYLVFQY
jgi:hypothetical protein